ncbi:conserved hypothetical protein [Shewanella sp. ANA-3]|uniref:hypothetical protein n=1 Tax=Shewanella sp. (strain ANA-3) TaxID=94122 RepID=UPI00005DDF90|nr:hypothetical protein [Shewanella sp. ANA-3]ABK48262.1 conserved hypothetical protein [Shewanella sp. ANA-3]
MSTQQGFHDLYKSIIQQLDAASAEITDLKIENKEGQAKLADISKKMKDIRSDFKDELLFLEKNSEWEKFTLAFFGETNAGKSTIIESLRILFDEQSRRELLKQNRGDLSKFSNDINQHIEKIKFAFAETMRIQADKSNALNTDINDLKKMLQQSKLLNIVAGVLIGATLTGLIFWFIGG